MFSVCRLIDLVVPDIPESLDIKIKRERFLAKEALQEAEHVLQVTENIGLFTNKNRRTELKERVIIQSEQC